MNLPLQILVFILFLSAEAMFAGMEIGVLSINRVRLQNLLRKKARGASELEYFLKKPEHLLGTTLVGTNLCMVVVSVMAAELAGRLAGVAGSWLSSLVATLVILVFAEYLPKAWFQANPAPRARHWSPLLRVFSRIFYPIGQTILFMTKLIFRVSPGPASVSNQSVTRDDLRHATMETERTGALTMNERDMIHGVFSLDRKTCRDIMTDLGDTTMVPDNMNGAELLALARTKEHNRYPVYQESPSHIVGIVHILDVATDPVHALRTARDYMRPPLFIPVETSPDQLLPRMRHSHHPLAILTWPSGKACGLVTLEDVLNAIVRKPQPSEGTRTQPT